MTMAIAVNFWPFYGRTWEWIDAVSNCSVGLFWLMNFNSDTRNYHKRIASAPKHSHICNANTVHSLLRNSSRRWTPLLNGHLKLFPAVLYHLYSTLDRHLSKTNTYCQSQGVHLRESLLYIYWFLLIKWWSR